jgi:hypothetical protein
MFCTQCGANNSDSVAVCAQCGRNLSPGQPPTALPALGSQTPPVPVPNYLVFAILASVLCCLPAGIPAIVYSAQVNGKLQAGDIAGAQAASNNAKMWCWISFALGLVFTLVMVVGTIRQIGSHQP